MWSTRMEMLESGKARGSVVGSPLLPPGQSEVGEEPSEGSALRR